MQTITYLQSSPRAPRLKWLRLIRQRWGITRLHFPARPWRFLWCHCCAARANPIRGFSASEDKWGWNRYQQSKQKIPANSLYLFCDSENVRTGGVRGRSSKRDGGCAKRAVRARSRIHCRGNAQQVTCRSSGFRRSHSTT